MTASEHDEATRLTAWLDAKGVVFCHVPNEIPFISTFPDSMRFAILKRLKAEGMKPGFPDFLIFSGPKGARIKYLPGVALELKKIGKTPTDLQMEWLREMDRLGWHACWAAGADDAIEHLEEAFQDS